MKELKKEKAQLEETVEVEKKRSREERYVERLALQSRRSCCLWQTVTHSDGLLHREVYLDRLNQFEGKARRFLKYFDNSDLVQQCLDKDRQIDALSKQVIDLSAGHDVKIGSSQGRKKLQSKNDELCRCHQRRDGNRASEER